MQGSGGRVRDGCRTMHLQFPRQPGVTVLSPYLVQGIASEGNRMPTARAHTELPFLYGCLALALLEVDVWFHSRTFQLLLCLARTSACS